MRGGGFEIAAVAGARALDGPGTGGVRVGCFEGGAGAGSGRRDLEAGAGAGARGFDGPGTGDGLRCPVRAGAGAGNRLVGSGGALDGGSHTSPGTSKTGLSNGLRLEGGWALVEGWPVD